MARKKLRKVRNVKKFKPFDSSCLGGLRFEAIATQRINGRNVCVSDYEKNYKVIQKLFQKVVLYCCGCCCDCGMAAK
jgi:hypothetical protein